MSQPEANESKASQENKELKPDPQHVQENIDPKSFCSIPTLKETKTLKAPFPIRLNLNQITCKFPKNFLEGYEVKDKSGIYCNDEEVIKKQSGVLKDIFTQVGKSLWGGTGLMGISMPVRLFEPRSMLERIADWFSYAPKLIKVAAETDDDLESLKYIICFGLSALFRSSQQLKPLNPMLGETYQCQLQDGTKIYLEHTCHTPPTSHFYVLGADNLYTISGYFDMGMGGTMKALFTNSFTIIPKGKITVNLIKKKLKICYQFPKITLGGALWGKRYIYFSGHMKFEDRKNNRKCVIAFANSRKELQSKRIHDIYGRIFEYNYQEQRDYETDPFYEDSMGKHPFPLYDKNIINIITGSWIEDIKFDNKTYYSIKDAEPPEITPIEDCLTSDSRYREDKQWLTLSFEFKEKYGKLYESYAQCWKLALEAQQRFERGLRKKYAKK